MTAAVADGGVTDFWAVMRDEADLSGADAVADWAERGEVVVDRLTATAEASQRGLLAALEDRGVDHEAFWIVNAVYVRGADADDLDVVRNSPEVATVRAPQTYEVPEPIDADDVGTTAVEWGVAAIGADRVWSEFGVEGDGIVVANIDTGVEFQHPALVSQYRGNQGDGTFVHDYNWFDPGGDLCATTPCDTDGHGTHTMGTSVGDDGGDNQVGVAPQAQWISALGCPFGSCPEFDVLSSAEFVLAPTDLNGLNPRPDLRAHVVNNSWGSGNGPFEDPFFSGAVDAWNAAGIFGVFSNGNSGPSCDSAGSPADDADAWGVGAFDITGTISWFSSRGPAGEAPDVYMKPDIAAPGENVRSSLPGGSYGSLSGTSMAAPHQTGAVALMWSASPATFGDVEATRQILDDSAVDVDDTSCGGDVDDNATYGEGRLDAFAAVDLTPRGPTGSVAGVVTDAASGTPIAGGTVTVDVDGRPRTTRTGADGRYTVRVPVGTFDVTAAAGGYRDETQSAEVVEGQETALDFALDALPRLAGTVTDANDGEAVAGATVTATPQAGGDAVAGLTAADGTYELILEVGDWAVTVEADGYATESADVTLADGQRLVLDVALRTGVASVDPTEIDQLLLAGEQRTVDLDLSNTGTAPLAWEALERGGGRVDGELTWLEAPGDAEAVAAAADVAAEPRNAPAPADGDGDDNAAQPVGPSSARWEPGAVGPQQVDVLVYADDPYHPAPSTHVDQALQRLAMPYTAFYEGNFAGFEAALLDGGWEMVVFANDNWTPPPTTLDALNAFAAGGGRLIAHSWRVSMFPDNPLWATLGARYVADDFDPPDPVQFWEADHALFTEPQSVPELTEPVGGRFGIYGQHVGALPDFEALGGYTEAPAPDDAALVVGNDDRTLFRGFLDGQHEADRDADGVTDGIELWENSIVGIEQGFFVDVPWLDVAPDSGTVEPGATQGLDVTIDTTGLEPGVYAASVVLRTDAARTARVAVPVRLTVTAYRVGVNVGGDTYTDAAGDAWAADRAFDGSFGYEQRPAVTRVGRPIAGTEDDPLYQDARVGGTFAYRFDELPAGTYDVELEFAEIQRRRPGRRLFDVTADTQPLLVGYDIAEDVGQDTAVTQRFTVDVNDGRLRLRFLERTGQDRPIVNAVRLTLRP